MVRPVAYIRQSMNDKSSSSPERQRETTDRFALNREWAMMNTMLMSVESVRVEDASIAQTFCE